MTEPARDLLAEIEQSIVKLGVISFSVHRGRDGWRGNVRREARGWVSGPETRTLREAIATALDAALDYSERKAIDARIHEEVEDLFG